MTTPLATVGRYHVERLIAHGGMGSLYLARDPAIDRLVVIKLLKEGFDDTAARERFAREARAAGRLQHPNIVTVFDVGEHENRPFIAMEYVAGETLHQIIQRRGIGRVWEKLAILEELCAGLHYAHGAAIVHRDIKPANVMRDQSGLLKILDFGIARAGGMAITRAGDVVGTLNYMSPEQLLGEHVDHRADIYSVGTVAYELITNQMAFPGTMHTGVLHKILNSTRVPIETLVPGIDPEITAVIDRTIARDPDDRYQDLETLRQDLCVVRTRLFESAPEVEEPTDPNAETRFESGRIASGAQPRPSSRASSTLHRSARTIAAPSSTEVVPPARRTRPIVFFGIACAALTIAVIAALIINRPATSSPPGRAETTTQPQAPLQVPGPSLSPPVDAGQPESVRRAQLEEHVSGVRITARQQIVAGQHESALDTLIGGLALDAKDPELNGLVDELAQNARRTASQAAASAGRRGSSARSSSEFREGQAREREANSLLRTGDRVAGIRALWAAAALYNRVPDVTGQSASAAPRSAAPTQPAVDRVPPPPAKPADQTTATVPAPEPLKPVTAPPDKPAAAATEKPTLPPVPPPAPKPEPPPAPRDPAPDSAAADQSAIRDTLRRYTLAYQSMDSAAVGKVMPSLTAEQLRSLGRDFSNYRSYTADIRDERIAVDGPTATVTCQVVRSFVTKNGVAGSNTVRTIFHLRRSGPGWAIERLESR